MITKKSIGNFTQLHFNKTQNSDYKEKMIKSTQQEQLAQRTSKENNEIHKSCRFSKSLLTKSVMFKVLQ